MGTAFFLLSKITWLVVAPLNSLVLLLVAWLACRGLGWRRLAGFFLAVLVVYGGALLLTPLPELAVRTLENRFPMPEIAPEEVAGIVLLGGATDDGAIAEARGQPVLNGAAERLTAAMALHRRMPDKPFIVSGFSGRVNPRGWNEAEITTRLFEQQGIDPAAVHFEARSRNTAENARFTAEMVQGAVAEGEIRPWLLVTSAFHMPRAVATFRATGLDVLPYPVDFRTEPARLAWPRDLGSSLTLAGLALHEWLGLTAYYVTGKSAAFFPAPR